MSDEQQKPIDPARSRPHRLAEHDIEVSPSGRRSTRRTYTVRVVDDEGNVREKAIKLDVTKQVRPAGFTPAPLPSFEEEVAKAQAEATDGADALMSALALQTMRQTPTEEQPNGIDTIDPLSVDPLAPTTTPEYTREDALKLLTSYLGAKLDGENVLNDEGVKLYLADNLGTLISSLDGTEEYVATMKANAKHPRFYFREGVHRAKEYLAQAVHFIDHFPWTYAGETPSIAITDLRRAQGYIGYAIAAITGRGSENPPRTNGNFGGDQFNEDGVVPYNPPGAPTIRPLEEMIATAERVARVLKALKEKRDEGIQKALERAPNELRAEAQREVTQVFARGVVTEVVSMPPERLDELVKAVESELAEVLVKKDE